MRLPITPQISTKDGLSNKNARLTNCLKEVKKAGEKAVVRPGLVLDDTFSGIGSGLIPFDGRLLVIYDDTVTDTEIDTFPWPLDSDPWSAGSTYGYGDTVWYGGVMFFSQTSGNIGNTPGSSTTWSTSYKYPEWDAGTTYSIGDPVTSSGTTYYGLSNSNTGNAPSSTPVWSVTPPSSSRFLAYITTAGTGAGNPGPQAASASAAAFAAWAMATAAYSCATKFGATMTWYQNPLASGTNVTLDWWLDYSNGPCTDKRFMGTQNHGTISQIA